MNLVRFSNFNLRVSAGWLALMLVSGVSSSAQATWTGSSLMTDNWIAPLNWGSLNPAPSSSTSTALIFAGSNRLTPDMTTDFTIKSLTFAAGAGSFNLGSSTNSTLTIDSGGITNSAANTEKISNGIKLNTTQTWTSVSGGALVASGKVDFGYNNLTIAGAGNTSLSGYLTGGSSGQTFTKNGAGTLTISGASNDFGAVFALNAGNVILSGNNALGGGATYGNSIAAGASLHLQNNITVNEGSFTVAGSGVNGVGAIVNDSGTNTLVSKLSLTDPTTISTASGALTLSGQIDTGSSALTLNGAGTTTVNGQISGSGNVTKAGAGATTFAGSINTTGAVTLGGSGTVVLQDALGGAASLTVSNSAVTTFNGNVNTTGDINLLGPSNVKFNAAVGSSAGGLTISSNGISTFGSSVSVNDTVSVGGSGAVTFSGGLGTNNHAINVTNSATSLFTGNVNAGSATISVGGTGAAVFNGGQLNGGSLNYTGSGSFSAASAVNVGNGSLNITGSGPATFSGNTVNAGSISISSSGNQSFSTQINTNSFSRTGTGTTVLGGTGNNYLGSVDVSGGTLLLNKTSGTAISGGNVTVTGATLAFGASNQLASYTNVTLGANATMLLNNTSQTLSNLTITAGTATIDFGTHGSTLSVSSLVMSSDAYLNVTNWSGTVDSFVSQYNPGSVALSHITINGVNGTTWNTSTGVIAMGVATPVPEPATYGALMMAAALGVFGWRKWRAQRRRLASPPESHPLAG